MTHNSNMDENDIGNVIIDTAIQLHKDLGPGLLEKVYEAILSDSLKEKGLHVERQVSIPIVYKGRNLEEGFIADLIVERKVIIELKSIEQINNAHKKQLLTYLRLTNLKLGYLLNFGSALMKDGIIRTINGPIAKY